VSAAGAAEPPLLWSESVPWPLSGVPAALLTESIPSQGALRETFPAEVATAGFSLPWRNAAPTGNAQAVAPATSVARGSRLNEMGNGEAEESQPEVVALSGSQSVEQVFGDVLGELGPAFVAAAPGQRPEPLIINPLRVNANRSTDAAGVESAVTAAPSLPSAGLPPASQVTAPGQLALPAAVNALPAPANSSPASPPDGASSAAKSEAGQAKTQVVEKPAQEKSSTDGPRLAARVPVPAHVMSLREPLERCLKMHEQMRLNTRDDGAWSIMHSFLGWGPGTEVHVGGPRGQRVNAIQWITQNQPCMGRPLFYLAGDHLRGKEGPGFQGHPAQFLAMLAQTGIDPSYPIRVNGRDFTVADLVKEEQLTCRQDTELTFKLIGLSYYTPTDSQWRNEQGEAWDFSRVVQIELASPINGAACGGTHRLMGFTFSLAQRRKEGKPIDGQWWRADRYIQDYQRYIMTLQNSDGSFSSEWFKRRADRGDLDRRVQTTGHMLEWLVFSLPDEGLYQPHVVQAVHFLSTTMTQHRFHEWEVGPKGHAARALRLYHTRVFAAAAAPPMARRDGKDGVK